MDNSSYRNLYIEKLLSGNTLSEQSAVTVQNFWTRLHRHEQKNGKTIEDGYTKEEFIRLITDLNAGNTQGFTRYKSLIKKYLEYLVENGALPQDNIDVLVSIKYEDIDASELYDQKYFKNFQDLQDSITQTLRAAQKVDDDIFATQISAIYMAWCGVHLEDALDVMKSDVMDDHFIAGGCTFYPNPTIMEYLKDYRDSVQYESAARSIITLKYVQSSYLFRTVRSAHVDDPKVMRIFIRNFGKSDPDQDMNLYHYDKVYWSGVYHRAYLYESENGTIAQGDIETISKVFNEKYDSISIANKRLQSYRKFADHFYPNR